jgi:4,4'-diaponeurosporenoate glycosyltransferase
VAGAVLVLLAVLAAGWLSRDLRTLPPAGPHREQARAVSVVVPARDEEATLPALLRSLQGLTIGVREVVVVDDASTDETASVARAGGAVVRSAGDPPTGWTGKAWACHVGARATHGDLLLFLDADTTLSPDALGGLLELHAGYGGLVSVQPFHLVARPYEQLSAYFNAVSVLASGVFRRRPGGRAMAFGPCLLTSRADYERAGGHAAVRAAILDDVELATAYARAGLPVRCAVGGGSVRMRSYPGGIRQLADGWTKNFASGASAAAPGPTAGAVAWIAAHHAVAVGTAISLAETLSGRDLAPAYGSTMPAVAFWLTAWVVLAWQLRSILTRLGSFRWWTWLLFPLPLLAFDVIFARSLARTVVRRSVRWRGREVRLDGPRSAEREA